MKEKLYTIPLNDAVNANDECPFCFIEREVEQDLLDFVLGSGSSYMESDVREITDRAGFCRILKTHYKKMNQELQEQFNKFMPGKSGFIARMKKPADTANSIGAWVHEKEKSCYICRQAADTYERYLDTFFYLYIRDAAFREKVLNGKGFCLPHFGDLCDGAESRLNDKEKAEFYPAMFRLMKTNMERLQEDVSWLVEKFDYRNKDADWKNSRDAIQRGMQKLKGGYPADPVYKQSK